ncbi:hypothetical protein DFH09DRAFT_1300368 [Mycena vulgaris]|nr:hypothetical protein DFH09DRAFT_1300368 [Mycena vulgaris]
MAVCSIPPNPDVSGVGVRAAIYAQNLTCFLPVIVHLWDGKISRDELKGIKDQSIGMLAVAFAILLSVIILAKGSGGEQTITNYHAAVVLDLSWMNNTSTWIWFILYVHHRSKHDDRPIGATWREWRAILLAPPGELLHGRNEEDDDDTEWAGGDSIVQHIRDIAQRIWRFISGKPVLTLGSIHLSLMAAVGIWLWSDPSKFGQPIDCADPTLIVVGVATHFSSKPLRIVSLTMYSLVLVPGLNLIPPFLFFLTLHISPGAQPQTSDSSPHTAFLIVGLVILVAINILFIVDIELTLGRNKVDQNGEDEWGFGQILALLLLIIPLRDAWGALQEIREKLKDFQDQFDELVRRECQATPIRSQAGRVLWEDRTVAIASGYGTCRDWAICRGRYGTALCAACANGKDEMVNALLQAGARLNVVGENVGAPLHIAVLMGNETMVRLLLDHNLNDANCTWEGVGNAADIAWLLENEVLLDLLRDRGLREIPLLSSIQQDIPLPSSIQQLILLPSSIQQIIPLPSSIQQEILLPSSVQQRIVSAVASFPLAEC